MQGWTIDAVNDTIRFLLAPPAGANNITVTESSVTGVGGTDAWAMGAWSNSYGWPCEIEYFCDRLWYARTKSDPQTVWGSMTGDYANFGKSTPIVDSDAVTFTINSRQVNAVMDLIPLDKMLILSKGGEFLMRGGSDEVITPTSISIRPQSYRGSGGVQAKVINDTALFIQEQGQRVCDIGYKFESDGYRPQDLSVWADHLCSGHTFKGMEWAAAPWSVLWLVRNDGIAVGMTYMPEQEVVGWHRHDTQGHILDVVCLPNMVQTDAYFLVRREVNGVSRVAIEQMAEAYSGDVAHGCYCDSALTYEGSPATHISGLDHLEGREVTVLTDGSVHPKRMVSGGAITLDYAASVVTVGLSYRAEIETLPVSQSGDLMRDKKKLIHKVGLLVKGTRGLKVGPDDAHLDEIKQREFEAWNEPTKAATGYVEIGVSAAWGADNGSVKVVSDDPLPAEILMIVPKLASGDAF